MKYLIVCSLVYCFNFAFASSGIYNSKGQMLYTTEKSDSVLDFSALEFLKKYQFELPTILVDEKEQQA